MQSHAWINLGFPIISSLLSEEITTHRKKLNYYWNFESIYGIESLLHTSRTEEQTKILVIKLGKVLRLISFWMRNYIIRQVPIFPCSRHFFKVKEWDGKRRKVSSETLVPIQITSVTAQKETNLTLPAIYTWNPTCNVASQTTCLIIAHITERWGKHANVRITKNWLASSEMPSRWNIHQIPRLSLSLCMPWAHKRERIYSSSLS
jgi:hypothetical protein